MYERDEILQVYFRHLETPSNPDYYDVVEYVDELVRTNPSKAWEIIRGLIGVAPSDDALAYVAAGPLENLLAVRGKELASTIREEALRSERVRGALSRVLLHPLDPDVRSTLGDWLPEQPSR